MKGEGGSCIINRRRRTNTGGWGPSARVRVLHTLAEQYQFINIKKDAAIAIEQIGN
jgi:hypothetical protein